MWVFVFGLLLFYVMIVVSDRLKLNDSGGLGVALVEFKSIAAIVVVEFVKLMMMLNLLFLIGGFIFIVVLLLLLIVNFFFKFFIVGVSSATSFAFFVGVVVDFAFGCCVVCVCCFVSRNR